MSESTNQHLQKFYRPADCCMKTISATKANPKGAMSITVGKDGMG